MHTSINIWVSNGESFEVQPRDGVINQQVRKFGDVVACIALTRDHERTILVAIVGLDELLQELVVSYSRKQN